MLDRYTAFCRQQYVPLHFQPWWLDAVCAGARWEPVVVSGGDVRVLGIWPCFLTRRLGLRIVTQPPFTAYGGPWLSAGAGKYTSEYRIYPKMLDLLPHVPFFRQNFHPEVTNWLPLYWAGFKEQLRYTYRFCPAPSEPESAYSPALCYDLRRARQRLEVVHADTELETLWRLNALSWQRQGRRQPYKLDNFRPLDEALRQRGQSALWLAFDKGGGAALAALYLSFDERTAGVLLSGQSEQGRKCAALHLLFHEAILFAGEKRLNFDFEGSMQPGIERAFRAYGARLTGYHQVWNLRFQIT